MYEITCKWTNESLQIYYLLENLFFCDFHCLMLFDLIQEYSTEQKKTLCTLWGQTVEQLAQIQDQKKILWFLSKCGIIGIEESDKRIHIGTPNEFLLVQVKKFFSKSLKKVIQEHYNPQFSVQFHVYPPFQKAQNDLQVNIKRLLKIKLPKQEDNHYKDNYSKTQELTHQFGIKISRQQRFDNYVVGAYNNFASSAAQAVAKAPWQIYNPLFIYGNVWLGKTHLMHAIADYIIQHDSNKNVLYLPTTKLIDNIVTGIRKNKLKQLMRTLDKVDVLLIDDIQFLADKTRTQEIFHNIFNEFHTKGKQVVLTSDRPPKELNNIEARLKSRFSLWLVADMQQPDYETRLAILQAKAQQKAITIPEEHLATLAKHITNNIRELEGALNIIATRQTITKEPVRDNDIEQCLKTLWYKELTPHHSIPQKSIKSTSSQPATQTYSFKQIVEYVSAYYDISVEDLKSAQRKRVISQARQVLMVIAKKRFSWTLERIGDYFGGKNHATVIYALNTFDKKMKNNKKLLHDYNIFIEQLDRYYSKTKWNL